MLTSVKRPARYTGGEWGAGFKADESGSPDMRRARICLAFPDVYEVGMSYLGYQMLYALVKSLDHADAERAYCPWVDMEAAMRERGEQLRSLESATLLRDFDAVGFTLQYELSHTNILTMLDLGGIPIRSAERGDDAPIVIAGGSGTLSPGPLELFIDVFCLGDGEVTLPAVMNVLYETKGKSRTEKLGELAKIPGTYVPGVSALPVKRQIVADLDAGFVNRTMVVPNMGIIHDRVAIQAFRGCTRGCRFCQAGMIDRPVRERTAASAAEQIESLLRYTGWEEVGLLSLATCDWSALDELLGKIAPMLAAGNIKLSLPSLRMDAFSVDLAARLEGMRRGGLTFAPEAGSERLRRVVNKGVSEADIEATLDATFRHGWDRVKLYFMMGLPSETRNDLDGIIEIANSAVHHARLNKRKGEVAVSLAGFVPKAHTPFQWEGQATRDELREKGRYVKGQVRSRKISLSYHEPDQTFLEGVYARGDRRLGEATLEAWRRGARFDGWTECFDMERWLDVFHDLEIDAEAYASRPRALNEPLPWDGIDAGVTKEFLLAERARAFEELFTSDCRQDGCNACGWQGSFEGCASRCRG